MIQEGMNVKISWEKEATKQAIGKAIRELVDQLIVNKEDLFPAEIISLDEYSSLKEKEYILHVIKQLKGNKSKTAKALGVDRKTLYNKLK